MTWGESHHGSEAAGALQVAKQEPQPQASQLLFQALTEKIILHVSVSGRLQFEVFRDARIHKGFGRSSEVRL